MLDDKTPPHYVIRKVGIQQILATSQQNLVARTAKNVFRFKASTGISYILVGNFAIYIPLKSVLVMTLQRCIQN